MVPLERVLHLEGCTVDLDARVVRRADGDRTLAPLEVKLLRYLAEQRGRAVDGEELLREVWGYRSTRTRTLATTVRRLREKIEPRPHEPVHICTVPGGGYRFEGQREAATSRIPRHGGTFVGRAADRAALQASWGPGRVVTVVGPAGAGKSRLAAEAIAESPERWVWVDLLGAEVRTQVLDRLADALGAVDPSVASLARLLESRPTLGVVLDDADGAVSAVAGLLGLLRTRTPWVVTSREPLAIGVEQVLALEGLPLDEAAALFVDRAGVPRSGGVDALVAALDGLPLAIELAAGWVPVWGVDELLRRVGSLEWSVNRRRDRSARHGSLRAAVETSCGALSQGERDVLRALATFAGPVAMDALEAVAGAGAADAVRTLAARSLVRLGEGTVSPYRVVAAFARQSWSGDPWEKAHGQWFAKLASPDVQAAVERGAPALQARLEAARDDLALAAERAVRRGDLGVAIPTAMALALAAAIGGRGQERVVEVVARVAAATEGPERAALLAELSGLHRRQGRRDEALRAVAEGLQCAGADPRLRGRLLRLRAQLELGGGDLAAADRTLHEGLREAERAGDEVTTGLLLGHLGFLRGTERRTAEAQTALEGALTRMRAHGQRRYQAMLLANLAQVVTDDGRDATPLYREAVATHRALGARHAEAVLRIGWGDALAAGGDAAGAHREFEFARETLEELGSPWLAARATVNDAGVYLRERADERAESMILGALAVLEPAGDRPFVAAGKALRGLVCLARGDTSLARLELEAAREALGSDGDGEVSAIVWAAIAVAERLAGKRDLAAAAARAAAEGATGPLAQLLGLLSEEASDLDPRWTALAAGADEVARLAQVFAASPRR